jgi:hypothetical protein
MQNSKPVSTPIAPHFKLSSSQSPRTDLDFDYMSKVPYSSVVDSLMYAMVCSHPDLSYAMSLVNRYMANPSREHWNAIKWIFRYCGVRLMLIYSLAELERDLLAMLIQILLLI